MSQMGPGIAPLTASSSWLVLHNAALHCRHRRLLMTWQYYSQSRCYTSVRHGIHSGVPPTGARRCSHCSVFGGSQFPSSKNIPKFLRLHGLAGQCFRHLDTFSVTPASTESRLGWGSTGRMSSYWPPNQSHQSLSYGTASFFFFFLWSVAPLAKWPWFPPRNLLARRACSLSPPLPR